jgi:hypothetical protein
MVQLTSCGNILVPISSSEGHQVTSVMRIPPQQWPARQHLRREQPDGAPELKAQEMSDIAEMRALQFIYAPCADRCENAHSGEMLGPVAGSSH